MFEVDPSKTALRLKFTELKNTSKNHVPAGRLNLLLTKVIHSPI